MADGSYFVTWDGPTGSTTVDNTPVSSYPKEFTIKRADNGFIVTIGCKVVVFTNKKELFDAMDLYFKDPKKAEEKYITKEKK